LLRSGVDCIGEPTPYDVFPVTASFFGAVDTVGFPRAHDRDRHDHDRGDVVEVWAYSDVDTVELFLDGKPLGARKSDEKKTVDGCA
jgi:beta-galactosidase